MENELERMAQELTAAGEPDFISTDVNSQMTFRRELESLLNRFSLEDGSNTPDWILANMLHNMLIVFDGAVMERERWYGRQHGEPEDWLVDALKPKQTRPIRRPFTPGE